MVVSLTTHYHSLIHQMTRQSHQLQSLSAQKCSSLLKLSKISIGKKMDYSRIPTELPYGRHGSKASLEYKTRTLIIWWHRSLVNGECHFSSAPKFPYGCCRGKLPVILMLMENLEMAQALAWLFLLLFYMTSQKTKSTIKQRSYRIVGKVMQIITST